MRFYILSDLHLRAETETNRINVRIKKLCSMIRKSANIGECILFIILGDIVDKGAEFSFITARDKLSLIREELKDYFVKYEFVPGNHDLIKSSLSLFDQLTSAYGSSHPYETASVYSSVYDRVNFIFADSTLSRDYGTPGRLDVDAIGANVKPNLTNLLFCHHALSHGHGCPHDVIEDSATVLAQLNDTGISFFFHGHVHDAIVTIPESGLVEIGCGSLAGGIEWLPAVFHQFLVGYIQDGRIARIERWVDTEDGHRDFARSELYPKPRTFSDPDDIDKIQYAPIISYIPRWVSLYEDAGQISLVRLAAPDKRIHLRKAVLRHKRVLLLCDAGLGKSIELTNLAHESSDRFHTLFYSLAEYVGQDIEELLPDAYRQLPPNRIALLLDGYDEIESNLAEVFKKKLKLYGQSASGVNIVISSRSNFCGNENCNKSRTFPGFFVYVLEELAEADIRQYIESKGIDTAWFWNCAYVKGVSELVHNPFYLIRLSDVYAKEKDLPPKNQLMDKLITESFDMDELKFSGNLGDRYTELFSSLEMLAIAMQLMHRQSFDDRGEYQSLVPLTKRELVKKSGLLKREGACWRFLHNNFREYLAARCLSRLPKDFVISIFYDGTNIKPYWVNTLGYLTGFDLDWNLIDWLMENSPAALVKFEPDRLNVELRVEVFKRIFGKFESLRLHFNDDLCDVAELAHFVNSNEILSFLIERISNPKHYVSQYTAVNILRCYPSLFDKASTVRKLLLDCCDRYPVTDKTICRLAMLALCQHKLQTEETTRRLMEKFGNVDEDYIRLGMYEYLLKTNEHNSYIEYCLSGIGFIENRLNDDDEKRISNEAFELVNCLKSTSTVESVTLLLKWFSQEKHPDFFESDEVLASAVASAVALYKTGHKELFDSILSLYLESARVWNTAASNAMVKFFVETETQYCAALSAAAQFEDEPHRITDLVHSNPTIIEYLKTAYQDGSLKSHCAFREIVRWYVSDGMKYTEYATLIRKVDGVDLPEYKAPVDYTALKQKSAQEYLEILFDADKRQALTAQLLDVIGNSNLTTTQLFKAGINLDHHSTLRRLQIAMYRYGCDVKVSEFFNRIDSDGFLLCSLSSILSEEPTVVLSSAQKEKLMGSVSNILDRKILENNITYSLDGCSWKPLTTELLSVILYIDYPLDEATLLSLTELPAFAFDKHNEQTKYVYLQQKLSAEKMKHRMIDNVTTQRVMGMVLGDHFEFFDSCKDSSLAEYAFNICNDQSDTSLRSTAWRYLYNTLGAEYVADSILPVADGQLLMEINGACNDIPRMKMCEAMEREYMKTPSLQLQAHLITFGSKIAIDDYVKKVLADKRPPEEAGIQIDGPTAAISAIRNPAFLPQLEKLLVIVLDPDFEDCTWHGLRNTLVKAFTNCGASSYKDTIDILVKHRPFADVNEKSYRYSNYIIEEVKHARKSLLDVSEPLHETKKMLSEIEKYY